MRWASRTKTSGPRSAQSVDYPDFAKAVAEGVAGGQFDRGILVCGTGVGMAIAANKVRGRALGGDRRHRHREAVARAQRSQRARARRARAAGIARAGDRQDVPPDAASKAAATRARRVDRRCRRRAYETPAARRAARRTRSCPAASSRSSSPHHAIPASETGSSASSSSCRCAQRAPRSGAPRTSSQPSNRSVRTNRRGGSISL